MHEDKIKEKILRYYDLKNQNNKLLSNTKYKALNLLKSIKLKKFSEVEKKYINFFLKDKFENSKKNNFNSNYENIKSLFKGDKNIVFDFTSFICNGNYINSTNNNRLKFDNKFFIGNLEDSFFFNKNIVKKFLEEDDDKSFDFFSILNKIFFNDLILIYISKNFKLNNFKLCFFDFAKKNLIASYFRVLIYLEDGASLDIIEECFGSGQYFSNVSYQIFMNRDASLNWYKVSQGGGESTYVSRIKIIQLEKSKSKKFNFFFKGRRFDNNIEVNLLKKESVSKVYSISNCRGFMEVNNFVKVFHKGERSVSYHLFKGIYDDNSRGVFHGIIHVDKNGNESKSSQYSKNLVLSNNSKIKISPELKIYNDNIVCNHGVTSSNLDKSMVFYLKSRGLGLRNIRNILVYAFMYEIFGFIDDNKVFLYLIKILNIRN